MQILKCSTKDITLLAAMNKCLIEDEQSSNTMNLKELEKRMSVFLSGEYDAYFFADDTLESSDKIVGYALVRNTASPLYLRQFYIKKEYRRKHLGSEAFKLLLDYLKADTIDIDVLPWNKSGMAFWKSIGFAEICVSMRYGEKHKNEKTRLSGERMNNLVKATAADFEKVRSAYIEIIRRTPGMKEYARWEYGKHPTDEMIQMYIDGGNMYLFMEDGNLAGVIAITFSQGEDYHPVKWQVEANDDEVMVLHILGIMPDFQGKGIGKKMIQSALELGRTKKMKACRFDALSSNLPAQKLYEGLGFVYCGKQHWFANNTGWTDFYLYELGL